MHGQTLDSCFCDVLPSVQCPSWCANSACADEVTGFDLHKIPGARSATQVSTTWLPCAMFKPGEHFMNTNNCLFS